MSYFRLSRLLLSPPVLAGMPFSSGQPTHSCACLHSAVQKLPAKRRHPCRIKADFHDCLKSTTVGQAQATSLQKRWVTCSASFPYTNKGKPINSCDLTKFIWYSELCTVGKTVLFQQLYHFFVRFWTQITGYSSTCIHNTATATHPLLHHTSFHQTDVYILNPLY